jgi:hypothetical protein
MLGLASRIATLQSVFTTFHGAVGHYDRTTFI